MASLEKKSLNFIEQIIESDLEDGLKTNSLCFRFPPEPNGFLHIGHAKAICLNFDLANQYKAKANLRFDDTNPETEEQLYVEAIKQDVAWLGYTWNEECYTSDYFEKLYQWAISLINQGLAYVDEQSQAKIIEQRKTPTESGIESPYRNRSIAENLARFEQMKRGELPEESAVLRAKIDMKSPNMHLRDPVMYRILKKAHHRTKDKWCVYPMYDWAHGQSDYIEQISHSLCSLEFENHRPLYDWYLDKVYEKGTRPKQREFARLALSHTVTSKRKLARLVNEGFVTSWDDPRMPTLSGMRRRGYPPQAIRDFIKAVGVAKRENLIEMALLEFHVREVLNKKANRIMAVIDPVRLVIENLPEGHLEWLEAQNNPEDPSAGHRSIPFTKTLYIEREDFKEETPSKFFRLSLGKEVRLKNAYIIKATHVQKDDQGNIQTIYCQYDPNSKSGSDTLENKRKVKGTLHWVSAEQNIPIKVRIYDTLFTQAIPDADKDKDFLEYLNPNSVTELPHAVAEPTIIQANKGQVYQFQRLGYFALDPQSSEGLLVFNRTVSLKDTWGKLQKRPKVKYF